MAKLAARIAALEKERASKEAAWWTDTSPADTLQLVARAIRDAAEQEVLEATLSKREILTRRIAELRELDNRQKEPDDLLPDGREALVQTISCLQQQILEEEHQSASSEQTSDDPVGVRFWNAWVAR